MSAPATSYRLYYPNTNALQAVTLEDGNGVTQPFTSWASTAG